MFDEMILTLGTINQSINQMLLLFYCCVFCFFSGIQQIKLNTFKINKKPSVVN
jgi:hypothetical protein